MSEKLLSEKGGTARISATLTETLISALSEREQLLARVSRQLHDDVSQVLSAVGLQLDAMKMDFGQAAPGFDQRSTEIQNMLEQAIEQLREISNELNPSVVERAGLYFALDRLVAKTRKDFPGTLGLHFDSAIHVPAALAKTLYKIAECALDKATDRAGCSLIDVNVKQSQGEFVLEVSDNGMFEDLAASEPSLERLLMDHYAAQEHTTLTITGSPDKGNVVRVACPVSRTENS
jgi:signal transduction histidine kinase